MIVTFPIGWLRWFAVKKTIAIWTELMRTAALIVVINVIGALLLNFQLISRNLSRNYVNLLTDFGSNKMLFKSVATRHASEQSGLNLTQTGSVNTPHLCCITTGKKKKAEQRVLKDRVQWRRVLSKGYLKIALLHAWWKCQKFQGAHGLLHFIFWGRFLKHNMDDKFNRLPWMDKFERFLETLIFFI